MPGRAPTLRDLRRCRGPFEYYAQTSLRVLIRAPGITLRPRDLVVRHHLGDFPAQARQQ
jgi:hypothetical protein